MKKYLLNGLIVILLFYLPFFLNAQISIDGQFRTKFLYNDGYRTLLPTGAKAAFVAIQRSRLNFNYQYEKLRAGFSIQDVRVWGESVYKTDIPSLAIYEAWGEILFNEKLSLKIGRQELNYDDQRLLGVRNWNDVGATHDVALLKFKRNDFNFHVGFAYNNDKNKNYESNYPLNYYKALGFMWLSKEFENGLNLSGILIGDGYQKENSIDTIFVRYTYGLNLVFNKKGSKLNYQGAIYHQSGKDALGIKINALFFTSKLTYKPGADFKFFAGIDNFSGTDALSASDTKKSFNTLYGLGHKYYGYMDYFTDVENDTKGGGLRDLFAGLNYNFGENTDLELAYHNFSFTNNVIDPESDPLNPTAANNQLGSEIDIVLNYKLSKTVDFKFGYSMMFATKSMEILKSGNSDRFANWGWVMVTFKPVFYKKEIEIETN